jgi:hypothetical protein
MNGKIRYEYCFIRHSRIPYLPQSFAIPSPLWRRPLVIRHRTSISETQWRITVPQHFVSSRSMTNGAESSIVQHQTAREFSSSCVFRGLFVRYLKYSESLIFNAPPFNVARRNAVFLPSHSIGRANPANQTIFPLYAFEIFTPVWTRLSVLHRLHITLRTRPSFLQDH